MSSGDVCLSSLLTRARHSTWARILRDAPMGGRKNGWWDLVGSLLIASGFLLFCSKMGRLVICIGEGCGKLSVRGLRTD